MPTILQFQTARILHDPGLRALRSRLGPLTADQVAGLHALDTGERDGDALREYLAAGIDAETWKRHLRAFGAS
jgi:hypothetical protein